MPGKPRGRPFPKGQSGNPRGRVPGPLKLNLTALLEAELRRPVRGTDIPQAEQLVHVVMQRALAGERWAAQLVWERVDGRVAQPHTFDLEREVARLAAEYGVSAPRVVEITQRLAG
jgi:hypothetical protein